MDELQQARVEIDAVDQEMARLFERRMAACRQVANTSGSAVFPFWMQTGRRR